MTSPPKEPNSPLLSEGRPREPAERGLDLDWHPVSRTDRIVVRLFQIFVGSLFLVLGITWFAFLWILSKEADELKHKLLILALEPLFLLPVLGGLGCWFPSVASLQRRLAIQYRRALIFISLWVALGMLLLAVVVFSEAL